MGAALVDEDQPVRVHAGQFRAEVSPLLLDLRAVLLVGAKDLLLAREPQLLQGALDGREAARDAQPLAQFLESRVGLLANQLLESFQVVRPQRGGASARRGLGIQRAGAAVELQQADDEGEADDEGSSGGSARKFDADASRSVVMNCRFTPRGHTSSHGSPGSST